MGLVADDSAIRSYANSKIAPYGNASAKYQRDAGKKLPASLYAQRSPNVRLPTYDCIRYPRSIGSTWITTFCTMLIDFNRNRLAVCGRTISRDRHIFTSRKINCQRQFPDRLLCSTRPRSIVLSHRITPPQRTPNFTTILNSILDSIAKRITKSLNTHQPHARHQWPQEIHAFHSFVNPMLHKFNIPSKLAQNAP